MALDSGRRRNAHTTFGRLERRILRPLLPARMLRDCAAWLGRRAARLGRPGSRFDRRSNARHLLSHLVGLSAHTFFCGLCSESGVGARRGDGLAEDPVAAAASSEVFTLAMPIPYNTIGSGAMRLLYGLARPGRTGTSPASHRRGRGDEVSLSSSASAEIRRGRGSDLLRRRAPRTTRSAVRPRHNLPAYGVW